jgi:hypothetical protein
MKPHRGKTLLNLPSRGRGTCPVCKTKRIKVLYPLVAEDGTKTTVCKRCQKKKIASVEVL